MFLQLLHFVCSPLANLKNVDVQEDWVTAMSHSVEMAHLSQRMTKIHAQIVDTCIRSSSAAASTAQERVR
jgi:hypothetical protein